jgi:hypothetical protein
MRTVISEMMIVESDITVAVKGFVYRTVVLTGRCTDAVTWIVRDKLVSRW